MRISTNQLFYSGTSSIQNGISDLYRTQNQLSTGRKILSPRDNPVDSTLALMTTQSKEVNASFISNQETAKDRLSQTEAQLGAVGSALQEIIERSIQGGNGTYSQIQKNAIAEELRQRLNGLVDLANAKDGAGEYLFAGNRTNTQPFAFSGNSGPYDIDPTTGNVARVSYAGDDGRRELQVGAAQTIAVGESGQDVFMRVMDSQGNLVGRSVFDAVQNMIDYLEGTSSATYTQALGDLNNSLDHVSRVRTTVGARLNQLDSLGNVASDMALQYDTRLSDLQSLDYAEAISRLNQQQMQLQAAQQSFARTSQLSLFDLIG